MAVSGSYAWDLTVGQVIEEAAERCGLDPSKLSERHLMSARNSLNLLFSEIENEKIDVPWRIERLTQTLGNGMRAFELPDGTVDVLDAVAQITSGGTTLNYPMTRTFRQEYSRVSDLSWQAAWPNEFWVDFEQPEDPLLLDGYTEAGTVQSQGTVTQMPVGGGTPKDVKDITKRRYVMVVRPRPNQDGVRIVYYRIRRINQANFLNENPDISRRWFETVCAGLAMRLAEKYAPDREMFLREKFGIQLKLSKMQSTDRGVIVIGGRGFGWPRRWRR